MSITARFVYHAFLVLVRNSGPHAGSVEATGRELAKVMDLSRNTLAASLAELEKGGYLTVDKPKSKSSPRRFTLTKFRGSRSEPPADPDAQELSHGRPRIEPRDAQELSHGRPRIEPRNPGDNPDNHSDSNSLQRVAPELLSSERLGEEEGEVGEDKKRGRGREALLDEYWTRLVDNYPHPGSLSQARIRWQILVSQGIEAETLDLIARAAETCREIHKLDPLAEKSRTLPSLPNFLDGGYREDRSATLEKLGARAPSPDTSVLCRSCEQAALMEPPDYLGPELREKYWMCSNCGGSQPKESAA